MSRMTLFCLGLCSLMVVGCKGRETTPPANEGANMEFQGLHEGPFPDLASEDTAVNPEGMETSVGETAREEIRYPLPALYVPDRATPWEREQERQSDLANLDREIALLERQQRDLADVIEQQRQVIDHQLLEREIAQRAHDREPAGTPNRRRLSKALQEIDNYLARLRRNFDVLSTQYQRRSEHITRLRILRELR